MRPGLLESLLLVLSAADIDAVAIGFAWARAMPSVLLVPAFGLRAFSVPVRASFALFLAVLISPALSSDLAPPGPWTTRLFGEILRGLPLAISAAVPLWALTSAGGLVDQLRGAQESQTSPIVEGRTGATGILLALLGAVLFLVSGGASRVALLLIDAPAGLDLLSLLRLLLHGVRLAIALGAPVLAASAVVDLGGALLAKSAAPAQIQAIVSPIKAVALIVVLALSLPHLAHRLAF